MNSLAVLKQNPEMISRTIDGRAIIMDPQEGKVLTLNEVGTLLWDMAECSSTMEDFLTLVCSEFEVAREDALCDLEEFTEALLEKRLLLLEE